VSVGVLSRLVGRRCGDRVELARLPVRCVREVLQVIVRIMNLEPGGREEDDGKWANLIDTLVAALAGFLVVFSVPR